MNDNNIDKLSFKLINGEFDFAEENTNKLVFTINEEQYQKFIQWKQIIEKKIIERELKSGIRIADREKLNYKEIESRKKQLQTGQFKVYYGTVENGYKFSFFPTSVIDIILVENTLTGDNIDLTDYDNW